jgi:hypothetical protein
MYKTIMNANIALIKEYVERKCSKTLECSSVVYSNPEQVWDSIFNIIYFP